MKQCCHGFAGLSPSARSFAIDSSSLTLTASKSEHEDSIWGDYTLDLSFLSSDDHRSCLDDDEYLSNMSRDVDTTKEGLLLEDKRVLLNRNPLVSKLPELLIDSSTVSGDDEKLELSFSITNVMSEKSSTDSVQDDSEEDSPCWIGINSRKTLASGVKSVACRRSTDDLSGFRRLNPLAPQFVPSNAKKVLEKDGKTCEENSSSSLKKSLSSNFLSSSGEFNLTDPLEHGRDDAARKTSILLTHNADENLGFASDDIVSKLDSRDEFQPSKRLDPLAPVFVPSGAKPSPSVHEKQASFVTTAHSTSALAYSDNKSLGKVKVDTSSGEAGGSIKIQYSDGVHKLGSTSSYNPFLESKVGITESAKIGSSSDKSLGQRRLNPLAPQFSLAQSKPKTYSYEKYQVADDLSLGVNTTGLSPLNRYTEHNVVDANLAQSSVYVERFLPNMSHGSSSLLSLTADSNFVSTKWFEAEPNTTLSVNGHQYFQHPLPFQS